ncbi:uncharacterized protein NPIL_155361 [Nephila pilipes]|uniref:Uncharacterized protein n=1 Tax=Nephila pilipes TaxID=299642 RepID=A0A8X6MXE3_NEPPI|nr:uncharacterized protein NPIL_155361 [Nephila pilipes]
MSQNGLFYTLESFRRLEDFSSYTSCIKCFGKPIIPPLVTEGQKEELSSLREIAIKKEIDILNRRKCHLHLSKKVKEIYHMVAERLSNSNIHDNFISSDKSVQYENSALDSTVINESPLSLSTNIRSFENSLHVSMTKIPSSDICSTVHKGVIVCPNVSDWNNKHKNAVDFVTKPSTTPKEFCFHTANPECRLCQIEHPHGPFNESGVPYENFSIEQICKIPEDDQGSLAEDTEFESLPTVICGKKLSSQDTDNESNFTCLTQSTDLEKYMDCSIEYSSPDDLPMTAKSQMSSQLNMSSRSDDASSETLVNTESELTPCASTMPELSDYINEEPSEDVAKINIQFSSPSLDVHQRAYSVDSYMNIIKSCSKNLLMRKSRSEPCQTEISQLSDINSDTSFLSNSIIGNESNLVNLEQRLTTVNLQNHLANLPVSDGELSLDNVKDLEGKKELLKKKHIRTNSYTLDQPSSALILAHADCNCKDDSESVMSPHSCSSEKMTPIPSNPAFKKEKINIILPPTPDRDKYYPVLNPSISANYSETRVESSMSNINESEISTESDACSPSTNSIAANNEVNINSTKISPENGDDLTLSTGKNIKEPDEQILVKSSKDQTSLKGEELQVFLNEIIHDIQECQQSRVQKLLEEQNRQWLQLQEEFVEQERLLCAKLNLVGISPTNDNVSGNKSQFLSGDKNCSTVEQTSSNILICPKTSNFSKLNIQNVCDENLAETHKPLKINFSRIPNIDVQSHPPKEESLSISNSIDVSPHVSFGKNISNSLDSALHFEKIQPCASTSSNFSSNTKVNVSISEDSLEKSKYIHSNISSESSDHSVKFLKSQSFDNSIDRTGSMLSETSNPSVPTGDNFVLMNLKPSNSSVSFNYQAITSVNSSFANNRSEEQQISTQKICSRILPQPPSGASFLSKNSLHNNSSYLFDQTRSSALKQSDSYASTNVIYSNSEMQYSSDKSVDRTNFYPHAPQNTGKSSSTYQPSLHCDIMALNEKGEYSQSILSCQHLNDLQHLNNLQTFTDVNSCTSVALPIASDLSKSGLNEGSLTSIPFGAFKEKKDIFSDVFSDDMNLNTNEEIESEKSIFVREHWFPLQDKIVMDDNLSVKNRSPSKSPEKNKISDQNHLHALNSNGMVNSSVFDARTHSTLPRKMFHKPMLSASSKSRSDSSIGQNVCKMYNDAASIMQAKAQKQISSISLTNLKRRQSREFIKDPNLLKKFEKLPALVKGYLTRRLFKTERVQGLMKTLEDTVVLIGKLSEELTAKGDSVSERDVDFHRQLLVQLMTTLHDIYDIFCTISIKERMKIISESRNLERKKKAAEMLKDYPVPVVIFIIVVHRKFSIYRILGLISVSLNETLYLNEVESDIYLYNCLNYSYRSRLSAATLKALERKRRTTIENRTYTIEDFKGCRPRIHSSTSSKSHSSPSRIYKSSIGLALKRKTTNARKTPHWK